MAHSLAIVPALIIALAGGPVSALAKTADPPPMTPPPVADYGLLPAMSDVTLSQDGQRIAFIGSAGDDHVFVVKQVGGPVLLTVAADHRKVMFISFADPDHLLLGIRGTEHFGGDVANYELGAVLVYDLKTRRGAQIYPRQGVVASGAPVAIVHSGGHVFGYFYGYAGSMVGSADVRTSLYKTDLDTLASSLEYKGEIHASDFAVGPDGKVIARIEEADHDKNWRVLDGADGSRVVASGQSVFGAPEITAFGRTAGTVVVTQPEDGDFDPPRELDLATGKIGEPLVSGAPAEILRDRANHLTIGFRIGAYIDDAYFIDHATEAKWLGVQAAFPGEKVSLASYDDGLDRWVVEVEGPHDSGRYFLVDLAKSTATPLGEIHPQIKPGQVGAFSWFDYQARDGTPLRGVLTLPPGRDPRNLPLVMLPHGGPGNGSYDAPHFDPWAQAIASRGYAVFQPDFRGSGGLGRSFERVGWGQWGRLMETDVSDAIPALAAKGIIDPKRACIVGWSYGGYATLAGVTVQHGLYRCAAAGGAVSDLNGMMWWTEHRSNDKLDPAMRYWEKAMGLKGASDPAGKLYSPAKLASQADAPILLIHGKDDTVVPFQQAVEMQNALLAAHKSVELVVLPTSDHWVLSGSQANSQAMLTAMVGFLEKYNPPE